MNTKDEIRKKDFWNVENFKSFVIHFLYLIPVNTEIRFNRIVSTDSAICQSAKADEIEVSVRYEQIYNLYHTASTFRKAKGNPKYKYLNTK